jgi:hypothetical protein
MLWRIHSKILSEAFPILPKASSLLSIPEIPVQSAARNGSRANLKSSVNTTLDENFEHMFTKISRSFLNDTLTHFDKFLNKDFEQIL